MIGRTVAHYTITAAIGAGGMGEVYRARDTKLNRDVAIKVPERVCGIPPEQVVGSSIKTKYELRESGPVLVRRPELNFIDDKVGKPVGINEHIGRRPILAFGNPDGDKEMLEWTMIGHTPALGLLLHHTDAEREAAYDRESHFGRLDEALDDAASRGWVVVDMKADCKRVFPD